MEDQLKIIREKIEFMKSEARESLKSYPKRYREARKACLVRITTLNGVLQLFGKETK
jgi:hypothetical protein